MEAWPPPHPGALRLQHVLTQRQYWLVERSPSYCIVRPVSTPWSVQAIQSAMLEPITEVSHGSPHDGGPQAAAQ